MVCFSCFFNGTTLIVQFSWSRLFQSSPGWFWPLCGVHGGPINAYPTDLPTRHAEGPRVAGGRNSYPGGTWITCGIGFPPLIEGEPGGKRFTSNLTGKLRSEAIEPPHPHRTRPQVRALKKKEGQLSESELDQRSPGCRVS